MGSGQGAPQSTEAHGLIRGSLHGFGDCLSVPDPDHSNDESRFILVGMSS